MTSIENYEAQVKEEQKILESELSQGTLQVRPDFEVSETPGFAVEEILTVLAFAVTSVAAGFLAEAGKDIWIKMKEACRRVVRRQKGLTVRHTTEIRVTVQPTAGGVALLYIIRSKVKIGDGDEVDNAMDAFWEALPGEIDADFSAIPPVAMVKEFKLDAPRQRVKWVKRGRREA